MRPVADPRAPLCITAQHVYYTTTVYLGFDPFGGHGDLAI